MIRLSLTGNRINDEGARHLSTCISKTEELRIDSCDITDKGMKMLAAAIKDLGIPVKFISVFVHFCGYNITGFLV